MRKTKEMYAGGFYLFQGRSSANSSFIEDQEEAMKFICTCNIKLEGYLIIHEFLITKDSWQILVELKSVDEIKAIYFATRKKSRRAKEGCMLNIVWKIVSEQLRGILSNFVVYTNRKNGRTGSKVARSYERFWFETIEEAEQYVRKMRKQLISLSQRLRKYQSSKNHFRIPKSEGEGAIFLCSINVEEGRESLYFGDGCLQLIQQKYDVLRQLVNRTNFYHNIKTQAKFYQKLE